MTQVYTKHELLAAKELVDSQILNRTFAENHDDRDELIHQSQWLDQRIKAMCITHLPLRHVVLT